MGDVGAICVFAKLADLGTTHYHRHRDRDYRLPQSRKCSNERSSKLAMRSHHYKLALTLAIVAIHRSSYIGKYQTNEFCQLDKCKIRAV